MTAKQEKAGARQGAPAAEVFRQFAWNLAGSLAKTGPARKPRPPVRRPRSTEPR